MMLLDVYRNEVVTATLQVTEENLFTRILMGEHKIVIDFLAKEPINVQIGDYIIWQGQRYYINTPPEVIRLAKRMMEYNLIFEGREYTLYNKLLLDEGDLEFSYFGSPEDHLLLLLENINTIDPGWTLGPVTERNPTTITYSVNSCRVALSTIAETFGLEFFINDRVINMVARHEMPSAIELEYGKGNGLYSLTRSRVEDKNVVTKLYPFGGTRNIPIGYRNGKRRLSVDGIFITQNLELYGIREGEIKFENIFPQRTSTVTAVEISILAFTDSTMDFDLNQVLAEGLVAKVVFKSGDLAGYEFEITSYNHVTKRFTINPFDDNGFELPNSLNKIEIGDSYTLVDIDMPQSYIDQAEADLLEAAEEYLSINSFPRVTYNFECDEKFIRDNNVSIQVGTKIRVIDQDLGIDVDLRVTELTYPIAKPSRITATISEDVTYSVQERLLDSTVRNINNIIRLERETDEKIGQIAFGGRFVFPIFGGFGKLINSKVNQTISGIRVDGRVIANNFVFDDTETSDPGSPGAGGGAFIWGLGSGLLSNQNDLQAALNDKANVTHVHNANAITTGVFSSARIPDLTISRITGLQAALDDRVSKIGNQTLGGVITFQGEIISQNRITIGSAAIVTNANEFIVQNGGVNALRVLANRNVSVTESVLAKNFVFDATDISNPGGGGAAIWGLIGGELPNQTDVWNSLQNINASRVNSGTLADARIPNLAAGKITSGVFADVRIPNLTASKITSGVFDNLRISSASVLQHLGNYVDRISNQEIAGIKQFSASVAIGNLSNPAASLEIRIGADGKTAIFGRGLGETNFNINSFQNKISQGSGEVIGGFGLDYANSTINSQIRFHRGDSITGGFISITTNNNSEAVRINSAGNFGIGVIAPNQRLQIGGNLRVDGDGILVGQSSIDGSRSLQATKLGDNLLEVISTNGDSRIWIGALNGVNRLTSRSLNNTGNRNFEIMIGTIIRSRTEGTGNHTIFSSDSLALNLRNLAASSTDSTGEVSIRFGWNNHIGAKISGIKRSTNVTDIVFFTETGFNTAVQRMLINGSNGNIGMGKVPVSGRALDVEGNIHASGSMFAANFVFG